MAAALSFKADSAIEKWNDTRIRKTKTTATTDVTYCMPNHSRAASITCGKKAASVIIAAVASHSTAYFSRSL